MALPSLSSLKQHHDSGGHGSSTHNSSFLLASSLHSNIAIRNHDPNTSLERNIDSPHLNPNSVANGDEKPVAVVHGKKNRLAYGHDDELVNSSIKRFCLSNERDQSNVRIMLTENVPNNTDHQCNDECFNGVQCHLRHSSSVPDLRSNFTNNSFSPNQQASHSAASSPSSSQSTPSNTFFSQIISSQLHNNGLSMNTNVLSHELSHQTSRNNKSESSKFQYVLGASTSMAIKMHEETMTYLNQGN